MFNFELSEKRKLLKEMAKKFAQKEILPVRDKFEEDYAEGKYVDKILLEAAKIGLLGFPVEEKYGGSNGNNIDVMVILEELAAVDGGMATVIGDTWFAMTPIIMAADSEQRERFLRPLASREEANLGAICMTEPPSGADIEDPRMKLRTCRTIVKEEGDELIINGTKIWPSNAGIAYLYVVVCTIDPKLGEEGSCLVVVEKDRTGLSFGKPEPKMGMHADRNSEVIFDNVRVPRKNMLGRIRDGAKILHRTLTYNRLGGGMISVGIARGAFEYALEYCKNRVVGGKPLIQHSLISAMFADMAMNIDAARLLVYRSAWANTKRHPQRDRFSNMAKVFATNMAMEVTTQCVQVMGSYGYSKEYPVEKYMRDAKIVQIFLGPNELLSQLIGSSL
ncbi:MAG: acyl-CoA dehydrogenase [Deltaproteobacteria bacterium]|nr:MAG: acyl-CoA dehydrogenase [Deltaproteobacteria bacterium]RLB86253.1 MAG: acyl-CoA dehydrogenase [Deltaproteobacteria bacterium]